jgi:hypothetical protein
MITPLCLSILGFTLAYVLHIVFVVAGIFFLLDACARLAEYKRWRMRLQQGADLDDLIERKRHTRCQREIVVAAAKQIGQAEYVRIAYYSMGYRWYHILPDWMFSNPGNLISSKWWAAFLGLR